MGATRQRERGIQPQRAAAELAPTRATKRTFSVWSGQRLAGTTWAVRPLVRESGGSAFQIHDLGAYKVLHRLLVLVLWYPTFKTLERPSPLFSNLGAAKLQRLGASAVVFVGKTTTALTLEGTSSAQFTVCACASVTASSQLAHILSIRVILNHVYGWLDRCPSSCCRPPMARC